LPAQVILVPPVSLLYRKKQTCPSPPFHISITSSLGIKTAARPAAISILLIFLRDVTGRSKRDVRASFRRFSQGITFKLSSLGGQRFAKKSSASTRKAADNFSRKRLDFERAPPKERFARLVDHSGCRSLLKSSNMYRSRRVLGRFFKIRLLYSAMVS
jgi:hypothetical protein